MMLTMSAGFLRCDLDTDLATDATGSSSRTCRAWSPLRPWTSPNSTRVPGLSGCVPAGQGVGAHVDVAAVVLGEEAEALLGVVPLHLASRHGSDLFCSAVGCDSRRSDSLRGGRGRAPPRGLPVALRARPAARSSRRTGSPAGRPRRRRTRRRAPRRSTAGRGRAPRRPGRRRPRAGPVAEVADPQVAYVDPRPRPAPPGPPPRPARPGPAGTG